MTVDERSRLQLAEALKRALGDEEGITLMELLPPVGWADVATKQDLRMIDVRFDALEARMDARFDAVDARFGAVDARFGAVDARFDAVDGRFDRIDDRLATLDSRFDDLTREFRGQTWRLITLMVAFVGVIVASVRL